MNFSFSVGTTFRCGTRTLEIVRQLSETEVALEDTLTRRPLIKTRNDLLRALYRKEYLLVLPGAPSPSGEASRAVVDVADDLSSLSGAEQDFIARKLAYIKGVHAARATRGQRQRVVKAIEATYKSRKKAAEEDGKPFIEKRPSASSVMDWIRKFEDNGHCAWALRSGNAHRPRKKPLDAQFERLMARMIRSTYLTRDRHTLQHTLDRLHDEADKLVAAKQLGASDARTSLSTLSRRIAEFDRYAVIKARYGEARARYLCRTTMGGAFAEYPLQRVEIDHTPLNWVVICDRTGLPLGRPVLTAAIDAFSGYVLGFFLSFYGPGLTSVSGVLRNAILPKDDFIAGIALKNRWLAEGIGDEYVVDNGLEFHSRPFRLMAWELAADLMFCRVRTPWLKPHVERFFGTLNYLTLTKGRIGKAMANVLKIDPLKDAAVTFSDLVRGLVMFVADVHPFEINERKIARPFDLFMEGMDKCPPAQYPITWEQMKLISALSKQLTVGQGGVELLGLPYGGPELLPLRRRYGDTFKTLVKWDPDDLEFIYVQDPKTLAFIQSPCRWSEAAVGVSWNQHRLARKFAAVDLQEKDAREALRKARLRLYEHWMSSVSRRSSKDALLAGQASGVTSARVFTPVLETPLSTPQLILPPSALVAAEDAVSARRDEIPEYDTFAL